MFGKAKKPRYSVDVSCAPVVREPSLAERLRDRRLEKVKAANDLDREIQTLDEEITWLERNPTFSGIMRELQRKYEA